MHWTKPHVLLQAGYLQVNLHVELDGYVKKKYNLILIFLISLFALLFPKHKWCGN